MAADRPSWVLRAWRRLTATFRQTPCATCGAPAVGLTFDTSAQLHTQDEGGQPVTRFYVTDARHACAACMKK